VPWEWSDRIGFCLWNQESKALSPGIDAVYCSLPWWNIRTMPFNVHLGGPLARPIATLRLGVSVTVLLLRRSQWTLKIGRVSASSTDVCNCLKSVLLSCKKWGLDRLKILREKVETQELLFYNSLCSDDRILCTDFL